MLLLCCSLPSWAATTWYACGSSTNISTAGEWTSNVTASCPGIGGTGCTTNLMTWNPGTSPANGDTLDANGCTSIAISADPGAATGASQGVCGTPTVTVTLQTNATNGGGFTLATAANLIIHANIIATHTTAVALTGSTNGATICGNVSTGSTASAHGVTDNHNAGTVYVIGNLTGGSANPTYGYSLTGAGSLTIVGNATAGSSASSYGLYTANAGGAVTMTGNCIGGATAGTSSFGCNNVSQTRMFILTGNVINGLYGIGISGNVIFTPSSTNYIVYPANGSFTLSNCLTSTQITNGTCTNATVMPTDPGKANVLNNTAYGPYTGTLNTVQATGGW
jgi:hypothetical protein